MKYGKYIGWLLALSPILVMRDFTPVNELTYLSIAEESLRDGHLFTLFNHGMIYGDKPPFYFWIIMAGKQLFGIHSMLWLSLFSFIPALIILRVMDKWTQSEMGASYRITAQLLLLTTVYFLGTAVVVRMDMLLAMFIVLALYTFYKMYMGKSSPADKWLFPIYIFMAMFTKGPFGLLIPAVSILVFLAVNKQAKQFFHYFGWQTCGIILFPTVLWILADYYEGGMDYLNNLLFHQTLSRALNSFAHKKAFYFYFTSMWYAMAPWVLLYVTALIVGIKEKIWQTPIQKLFLITFGVTFLMLSCVSAKLEIYLLPAYPFLVFYTVYVMEKTVHKKVFLAGLLLPSILICFALPTMFVMKSMHIQSQLQNPFIYAMASVATLTGIVSAIILCKGRMIKGVQVFVGGFLCALFVGGCSLPSLNAELGYTQLAHRMQLISKQTGIHRFCGYYIRSARDMDVYFHTKVVKIPNDSIEKIADQAKPFILFMPEKYAEEKGIAENWIKEKPQYREGDYHIIIYN
jgi:4-amino-4-deoxy-L-arabinose transferase-like glycosyltransferase